MPIEAPSKRTDADFALAARFVAALYSATAGKVTVSRLIDDCAERAGIEKAADVQRALSIAEAAGFIVVHVHEPRVTLTAKGRDASRRTA